MIDDYAYSPNPKRLYRSRSSVIGGVCHGVADRFGWDPTLVRVIAVVALVTGFAAGPISVAYLVLWAITPVEPLRPRRRLSAEEDVFWRSVNDRPADTLSNIRYKFKDMDSRLANIERSVTSEEWRLKRQFRDLEGN